VAILGRRRCQLRDGDPNFHIQGGAPPVITYPLVNIQKAIENGLVEIVDLPMKNGDVP